MGKVEGGKMGSGQGRWGDLWVEAGLCAAGLLRVLDVLTCTVSVHPKGLC